MLEILFRGKREDNGNWIQGSLFTRLGEPFIIPLPIITSKSKVAPETVGQFTGLTDKNGKKIFEGDILTIARKMDGMGTYYSPAIEYPVNVAVKWDMCAWMWETICKDKRYIHFPEAWCHLECEVIGNIHDNPELLEV